MIRGLVIAATLALSAAPAEAASRDVEVPILLYHHVAEPPTGSRRALYVPPDLFAAQLRALKKAGFTAVTLERAWAAWTQGRTLPKRPVVVSFDDGYLNQITNAAPALRALRWPAVLNLSLDRLGVAGGLKKAHVRTLVKRGWQVDAHSLTHRDLLEASDDELREEIAGSRAALKRELGITSDFFCYPFGHYDARVQAAVKAAGFKGATTTRPGAASRRSEAYALPRVVVTLNQTPSALVRKLRALQR